MSYTSQQKAGGAGEWEVEAAVSQTRIPEGLAGGRRGPEELQALMVEVHSLRPLPVTKAEIRI